MRIQYRILPVAVILFCCLTLLACTTTQVATRSDKSRPLPRGARVLLMPLDIELSVLTAAGDLQPRADWTEQAKTHATEALREFFQAKQATVVPYRKGNDAESREAHTQLIQLHDAVRRAIVVHHFGQLKLPNKRGKLDWGLGENARVLAKDYEAEYALFIFGRDSYATAGRKALAIGSFLFGLALALGGSPAAGDVVLEGGMLKGVASLVDLRSGEIIWFNILVSEGGGLQTFEGARGGIQSLLRDFPL